jgi:hypothetical protein
VTHRPTSLAEVIARHAPGLMARPGVVGVGEGESDGQPCLIVFMSSPPSPGAGLPQAIEGFPVVVRPMQPLEAQPSGR